MTDRSAALAPAQTVSIIPNQERLKTQITEGSHDVNFI